MSSPDCKRQKLADDVNSVEKMSEVLPEKNVESQIENRTSTASTSKKLTFINVNAQKFEEVAKSDGFVDRTLLIEELLQGKHKHREKYVMILVPSNFGKTLNLDMIRLFCDIEDKNTKTKEDVAKDPTMEDLRSNPSKNMKVFLRQFEGTEYEECLILKQEQFVIQHFGRHPVVLFDFKDCRAKNESQALFFCAQQVRKGYLENIYLKNSEELHYGHLKNECTDWINYSDVDLESLHVIEVMSGLQNLIKSLSIHWGRKPVFLLDELDKPYIAAMESELSEEQVLKIGNTIIHVICSILKTDDKQVKLQAALLTGICKFITYGFSSVDNTLPVHYLTDYRFSKYYGLTAQEVHTLVEKLCSSQGDAEKTNKIISDINAKYNGYYQNSHSNENKKDARYCIFSVLNYMKNINTEEFCFWSDGDFLTEKLVPILRKCKNILSDIQILVYDDSGTIEIGYEMPVHVNDLIGLYHGEIKPIPSEVFNFFLLRGYLARNLEKPIENVAFNRKMNVRIPNLEIKEIFKNVFKLYYKSLDENIHSKLISCGQIFKSLPTQDSTEFQNNLVKLCEYLKCIFEFMECIDERTICSHILTILKHHAEYEKGETDYAVKYFDDNGKEDVVHIDVWGRHGNFAIIFGVKFNYFATGEPGKIGYNRYTSLAAAENIVKLLPGKKEPEGGSSNKAGTGRHLEVLLKSQIENYVLIGLAVDGDYTTHMLVFRDTSDWKNVIQVNPENYVAELIATHLK